MRDVRRPSFAHRGGGAGRGVGAGVGDAPPAGATASGVVASARRVGRGSGVAAGAAELVAPVEAYVPPFAPLGMGAVAPEGVAAALERLYVDRVHRGTMARAAYRNATRPDYRWGCIADQWRQVFDDAAGANTSDAPSGALRAVAAGGGAAW